MADMEAMNKQKFNALLAKQKKMKELLERAKKEDEKREEEINELCADDQETEEGSVAKVSNPCYDDQNPDHSQAGHCYIGPVPNLSTEDTPSVKVSPLRHLPTAGVVRPVVSGPLTPVIDTLVEETKSPDQPQTDRYYIGPVPSPHMLGTPSAK